MSATVEIVFLSFLTVEDGLRAAKEQGLGSGARSNPRRQAEKGAGQQVGTTQRFGHKWQVMQVSVSQHRHSAKS